MNTANLTALLSTALFLLVGTAVTAASSSERTVNCGDTITSDTTLDRDLRDCPNNGIVIGADGVTLNLNGHTIDGDGRPFEECGRREPCDVGVFNDRHDDVTVRGGSTRGFGVGILIGGARANRILSVLSTSNVFFGFVIADSSRSVIRGSAGSGNPVPEGDGLGVFASHHLRIVGNEFRRNALGMHIEGSTDILVRRNRMTGNSDFGLLMEADRNVVRGNRTARNGSAIGVGHGSRNVIAANRSVRDGEGIWVERGRGNVFVRNVVIGPRYSGIRLGIVKPSIGSVGTLVRGNVVRAAGRHGFEVNPRDRHSRLIGNTARRARRDGFHIASRSARLTGNRAFRNADLGFEAVPGVIDAGGNSAHNNGDARQCTYVWCW